MSSLALAIAALLFIRCRAEVDFTNSKLLDEFDFKQTVQLDGYCPSGCRIYVSIPPESADVAKKIKVHDYINNDDKSLYDISLLVNGDQKDYYRIDDGNTRLNIINTNTDSATAPMAVWIVKNTAVNPSADVFDAANLNMAVPRSLGVVTVMGATPFTLTSKTTGPMLMLSTLTGFDAINGEAEPCINVLEQFDSNKYADFHLGVRSPLISFFFDNNPPPDGFPDTVISLKAKPNLDASYDFFGPSFVASPGFVGCAYDQTFRSSLYAPTTTVKYSTSYRSYDVDIKSDLNTDADHPVKINDVANGQKYEWSGSTHSNNVNLQQTNKVEISWTSADQQSFLILLTPSNEQVHTTTGGSTTEEPTTTTTESIYYTTPAATTEVVTTTQVADDTDTKTPAAAPETTDGPAATTTDTGDHTEKAPLTTTTILTTRRTTTSTTPKPTSTHPKDVTTQKTTTTTVTPTTSGVAYESLSLALLFAMLAV